MWTAARWLRFVEARAATTIDNLIWNPGTGQLTFGSPFRPGAEPQSMTLPQTFAGRVFAGADRRRPDRGAADAAPVNGLETQFFQRAARRRRSRQVVPPAMCPPGACDAVDCRRPRSGGQRRYGVATLTVYAVAAAAGDVTVTYATSNGTATAAATTPRHGSVVVPRRTTSAQVAVTINGDALRGRRDRHRHAVQPGRRGPGRSSATLTIINDDVAAGGGGRQLRHAVWHHLGRAGARRARQRHRRRRQDRHGRGHRGPRHAAARRQRQRHLTPRRPVIPGPTASPTGWPTAAARATSSPCSITVGRRRPALSVTGVTVAEGDSGTVNAVFPVTLSAASGKTVSVAFAIAAGTATTGVDFVAASGPLRLRARGKSQAGERAVIGDMLVEPPRPSP